MKTKQKVRTTKPQLPQVPLAVVSVYDKSGVVEFAQGLGDRYRLVSTSGTLRTLRGAGLKCREVSRVTGFPEILGGRVKTISPIIAGGILARHIAEHEKQLRRLGIHRIKLVCVNLYPFLQKVADPMATLEDIIENIDIGGVLLLREAAKAYAEGVIVICDPGDYQRVLDAMYENGTVSDDLRLELAQKAFQLTAQYDAAICTFFANQLGVSIRSLFAKACHTLRKPENDDQGQAVLYRTIGGEPDPLAWPNWQFVSGNPGYVNLCGGDSALRVMCRLTEAFRQNFNDTVPNIVIACKHGNPCGIGVDWDDSSAAIRRAMFGDPAAVMGAEVMTNFPVDGEAAIEINVVPKPQWKSVGRKLWGPDVIFAPSYSDSAEALLTTRDPERHLLANVALLDPEMDPAETVWRPVRGGYLEQKYPRFILSKSSVQEWLGKSLSDDQLATLLIAWVVAWEGVSNSMTLAKDMMLVGTGLGQQDRRGATKLAISRARDAGHQDLRGSFFGADGFFPFAKADNSELLEAPELLHQIGCAGGVVPADGKRWQDVRRFLVDGGMSVAVVSREHRGFAKH